MEQMPQYLLAGCVLALAVAIVSLNRSTRKVESTMGVVADTLNQVNADLTEARDEILAELNKLANKPSLDDDDKAALAAVAEKAKGLADIVPNAVTEPLPDPSDPGTLDPSDSEVIDPEEPVDEPAPEPSVDPFPADGSAGTGTDAGTDAGAAAGTDAGTDTGATDSAATPTPVDPSADPVPAGDLASDASVVEVPADASAPVEVPADASVVEAGSLPEDTLVVEVEQPAADASAPAAEDAVSEDATLSVAGSDEGAVVDNTDGSLANPDDDQTPTL
jgi:hypothetical protein